MTNASHLHLPLARVKKIMKQDPDVQNISTDAVIMASLATNLFVQYLSKRAHDNAVIEKRKTVQYKDLAAIVRSNETVRFLEDTIPPTLKLKAALKYQKEFDAEREI